MILEAIKERYPSMHIHAFSPMEVYHASQNTGCSIKQALSELRKCGLDSMPGTAAEILVDDIRRKICPNKLTTKEWVDIVMTAHTLGIPTTATMMYGHIESWDDRIKHILLIREIQKKTGGFTEFVPLPFMPKNNELGLMTSHKGGVDDLKVHAIARILLHRYIKNVQASWVKLGKKLAQVALMFGANDLGGTLMEENISKSAGGLAGECLQKEEFENLIREIGRIPKQRDTLYRILDV